MLTYLLGIIAGAASTTQVSVNGRIREDFKSAFTTAILSFGVASLIMALITVIVDGDLRIPFGAISEQPFWIWLGGSCGTVIVILNVLCLPKLGSARNVMIVCFGQIMAGLIIDHFGLFGALPFQFTLKRVAGALLVTAGIVLVNRTGNGGNDKAGAGKETQLSDKAGSGSGGVIFYVILALLNGVSCASQVAINGTLTGVVDSASKATLISMAVGLITTIIVTVGISIVRGPGAVYDGGIKPESRAVLKPWMVLGGSLAIVIVGGNAVIAPLLGTGVVTIMNLIGMIGTGLIIDAVGFLGIEKKPVTAPKFIGMLLMIGGTALISL